MIKFLGTIFILFSCITLSQSKIKNYNASLTSLRALINSLKEMADNISFRKMPLPEITSILKERKEDVFFKKIFSYLKSGETFSNAWEKALTEEKLFPANAKKPLSVLGKNLGSLDAYHETENIHLCICRLDDVLSEMEITLQKNSKMLKSFGVLSGLLIVIIFI